MGALREPFYKLNWLQNWVGILIVFVIIELWDVSLGLVDASNHTMEYKKWKDNLPPLVAMEGPGLRICVLHLTNPVHNFLTWPNNNSELWGVSDFQIFLEDIF